MSICWEILIFIFIIFWAAEDVRTGGVGWLGMVLLSIMGAAARLLTGKASVLGLVSSMLPGLLLIPLSFAGDRYIGGGDVLGFLVCGIYIGFSGTFELMMLSFAGAGIWGLFLLKIRKKDRTSGFPFFPFLLAAQGIRLVLMLIQNM